MDENFFDICDMDTPIQNSTVAQGVTVETVTNICGDFTNQVHGSFPSIFTREDVIYLLTQLEAKLLSQASNLSSKSSNTLDLDSLKEALKERIERVIDSHDYDDNAEFELSGRSIILDFSSGSLSDEAIEAIDEVWDEIVIPQE